MPRKKIEYTHLFPYHITARCNNKDWFYAPLEDIWHICHFSLRELSQKFGFKVHAFVLMSNHYHLLASTHEKYPLGFVMHRLQNKISKSVNRKSERIDHLFGGRYKASTIKNPFYFAHCFKYIYQNPLRAGICKDITKYPFSTLHHHINQSKLICRDAPGSINYIVEDFNTAELLHWLNSKIQEDHLIQIKKGIIRSEFKISVKDKKQPYLNSHLC